MASLQFEPESTLDQGEVHLYIALNGPFPVQKCAREGRDNILKGLIGTGYSVNTSDYDLVTPLHEACFHGHYQCVQILLQNGAEVNSRNIDGATPICDACSSGKVDCVRLLLQYGASVNPQLLLTSPLHEAVMRDQWRCVELLIDAGANLNTSDCHYGTPLHIAATLGCTKSAELLLKAGADVNAIKTHNTALHDAARQHHYDMVYLLLQYGANTNAENNGGLTPIDLVSSSTNPVKQLLIHWQSNVRKLKEICRLVIRENVGASRLVLMDQLYLPKLLIDYLMFNC